MPRRRAVAALALGALLAVPACSSSGSSGTSSPAPSSGGGINPVPTTAAGATPTPAATAGTTITIKSFAFQPAELTAKVGDTVTVTNDDGTNHSATAVDGSFDTDAFSSGSKTFTLTKAGRIEYKCKVHSFMPHAFIQVT